MPVNQRSPGDSLQRLQHFPVKYRYNPQLFVTDSILMNKISPVVLLMLACLGCSNEGAGNSEKHVWSEQTETINKAKQVEATILESAEQQQELIDQQTH